MHRREARVRNSLGIFFFRLAVVLDPDPDLSPEPDMSNVVPIGSANHPSRGPR